jgi:lipopolysaccharide assembly outer membrane protein LptD (OstA)
MAKRILAVLLVIGVLPAAAQSSFETLSPRGCIRDAAVDARTGRIYAAVYDRAEVWVYAPDSLERLARIPVEEGPVALALSADGKTLACVNRMAASVSLIALPEERAKQTVKTGEAPASVTPMPDGRFCVTETFADAVSFLDPQNATVSRLAKAPAVPMAAAVSSGYLAVAGRAGNRLALFPMGSGEVSAAIDLEAALVALEALPEGRFLAATATDLLVIDAEKGGIVRRMALAAQDAAVMNDNIHVITPEELLTLDPQLNIRDRMPLPDGEKADTRRIIADAGVFILLTPAQKTGRVWNAAGLELVRGSEESAPVSEVTAEPVIVEARPMPEEAEPVIVEARPMPEETEPLSEAPARKTPPAAEKPAAPEPPPLITPEPPESAPDPAVKAQPEERDAAPEVAAVSDKAPEIPPQQPQAAVTPETPPLIRRTPDDERVRTVSAEYRYSQTPVRISGARAPGRLMPSANPLFSGGQRSLSDIFNDPTQFIAPGAGFEQPDWTEPMRDIEADTMTQDLSTGTTELHDNVRLRLGNMFFRADNFTYSEEQGEMHAWGNVVITQEDSRLEAEEVYYYVPQDLELPPPTIFESQMDEQEREKKRLSLGMIDMSDVYIVEPEASLKADNILYDFASSIGEFTNPSGHAGMYYFAADKLKLHGPETLEGDDVWVTTCDIDPPPYRFRVKKLHIEDRFNMSGTNARLQIGKVNTPFFLPRWRNTGSGRYPWSFDFDSGRRAEIGYYINTGQRIELNPYLAAGPRIFATEKEGVGLGGDINYDYMQNPASRLYRTKGEIHGIYTTEERGYIDWQHRWEFDDDLNLKARAEQWSDRDFYKEFFYDEYQDRTGPRTYANISYRQDGWIASGTARINTHSWMRETERMPEAAFHLVERKLAKDLYLTFDTVSGYNDRNPYGSHGLRTVNITRLTWDLDPHPAFSITPWSEIEGTWYSKQRIDRDESAGRFASTTGVTLQTRLKRQFGGRGGFEGFRHIVVPSLSYSYRPATSLDIEDTPFFDAWDAVFGRSRIETKLDNILFGKDAESGFVWQVARLSLYQGNDFWNETRKTDDYEIEIDLRPRPWWGFQLVGEQHNIAGAYSLEDTRFFRDFRDDVWGWFNDDPYDVALIYDYGDDYGDYNRVLTQLYYDNTLVDGNFNGRIGFAYTGTSDTIYNREVLYGIGYKLSEKWGVAFEHRYDLKDDKLRTQTYEVRRSWRCWESAVRVRDRESGTDIDLEINIKGFPGSALKL